MSISFRNALILVCLSADVSVGADVVSSSHAEKVFRAGDRVAWIGDSITSCAHRLPHGYITTIEKAAKETGTPGFDNIIGLGKATVAVFAPMKPGGLLAPVPGYGHADCAPFTGDSTGWTPTWCGGSLEAFKGRRVAFELRFRDCEAYSLAGNMTPMMWVQVQQYEEACVDPMRSGW